MHVIRIRPQPTDPHEKFYTGHGWSAKARDAYQYPSEEEAEQALRSVCRIEKVEQAPVQ